MLRNWQPAGSPSDLVIEDIAFIKVDLMISQQCEVLIFERLSPMVLFLGADIVTHALAHGLADGERSIPSLPFEP